MKNKDLWIAFLIAIVTFIPYSVWYIHTYNKIPILGAAEFYNAINYFKIYVFNVIPMVLQSPFPGLIELFPNIGNYLTIFFIIGILIILFNLVAGFNLITKNEQLKKYLFIFLWMIIPFLYFAFIAGQVPEDRYLLYIYPAIFYSIALAIFYLYDKVKKFHKYANILAIIILSLIIFSSISHQLRIADNLIKTKSTSYIQFKQAGIWMEKNSDKDAKIIAAGVPQLSYYTNREVIYWPSDKEEFNHLIKQEKVKYLILSRLEGTPDWSYSWPEENKDKVIPVQAYLIQNNQPILVIYQILNK